VQAELIRLSWAENGYDIEKTDYFQCLHGEIKSDDLGPGEDVRGVENIEHHCIDYSGGKPFFVRGTYLMVMPASALSF
jgi:hypothetical protein